MESNILNLPGNGLQTGTRAAGVTIFYSEITQMIIDSRWILVAVVLCCVLDFRFGCKESVKRKEAADKDGNALLSDFYHFHRSRAIRRSSNKFVDYVLLMMVSESFGAAFLPYIGVPYIYGAWAGGLIACGCEISSVVGHFLYIHGVKVEKKNAKGYILAFVKALAVAFARQKAGDQVGEALEHAFNETEKKGNKK
ncbi:MAG: hypothetical protein LKE41_00955 [Prevotella sp.]|jgi:hypothetical protein|nr:hypothetical protein [Prevotella sp.]